MWRCASRSIAGALGALAVHQSHALADSSAAVGVRVSANNSTLDRSTASEAATTTTKHLAPDERQRPSPGEQPKRYPWPEKLQQDVHFAVLKGSDGTRSDLTSIAAAMAAADVVFLGEYHDDPVAHALQVELLKRAAVQLGYPSQVVRPGLGTNAEQVAQSDQHAQQQQQQQRRPLILSMEMFERDVQPVLDEYLAGTVSLQDLMRDSRPWPNYLRDYAPLVQYCKQQGFKVVAANAPRRYVSLVGRSSRDALLQLSAAAHGFLAPLPYGQPSQRYVSKVQNSMKQAAQEMQKLKRQQQQQQPLVEQGDSAGDNKEQEQQEAHVHQAQQYGAALPSQQRHSSSSSTDSGKCDSSSSSSSSSQEAGPSPGASHGQAAGKLSPPPPAAAATAAVSDSAGTCPYIGFNVSSNFLDAQGLWDATMAHSIAQQLTTAENRTAKPPVAASLPQKPIKGLHLAAAAPTAPGMAVKPLVIHVCGKFHCEEGLGIPEHLAQYASSARMLSVVFVPSKSMVLTTEEFWQSGLQGLADYVVLTDGRLPRSFDTVHPI